MASDTEPLSLQLRLDTGEFHRRDLLAAVQLPSAIMARLPPAGGTGIAAHVTAGDGATLPAQLDENGRLTWLIGGELPRSTEQRYTCRLGGAPADRAGMSTEIKADRLLFSHGGRRIASYIFLGTWKPYFWPIMTAAGNVVRGASGEHQHQTGLFLAYGGHGGPTTSNVWSDWDEPPYGPDGKMLHVSWERVEGGPVYGRFVERLLYTNGAADYLLEERREIRLAPLPDGSIIFDICQQPSAPQEAGPSPFILAARIADPLRLVDLNRRDAQRQAMALERPGRLSSDEELHLETPANATYRTTGRWLDWCGDLAGGVAGLAFFDHPDNPQEGRGLSAGGYGCMTMRSIYPAGAPSGSVRFQRRAVAHPGDGEAAGIAQQYQNYAHPPKITVEG
jgi:hypothetical protein